MKAASVPRDIPRNDQENHVTGMEVAGWRDGSTMKSVCYPCRGPLQFPAPTENCSHSLYLQLLGIQLRLPASMSVVSRKHTDTITRLKKSFWKVETDLFPLVHSAYNYLQNGRAMAMSRANFSDNVTVDQLRVYWNGWDLKRWLSS